LPGDRRNEEKVLKYHNYDIIKSNDRNIKKDRRLLI